MMITFKNEAEMIMEAKRLKEMSMTEAELRMVNLLKEEIYGWAEHFEVDADDMEVLSLAYKLVEYYS